MTPVPVSISVTIQRRRPTHSALTYPSKIKDMKNIVTFIQTAGKLRALSLLVIFLAACQGLDEKPQGIATPSTFYSTLEQCEAALAGAMAPLWGWYVSPG